MPTLDWLKRLSPGWLIELFVASNLGFLALDVWLAHAVNSFRSRAEWIPVCFSLAAPLALLPGLWSSGPRKNPRGVLGTVVGWFSVLVGVAGLVFHLDNAFFELQTLKSLVYTAPFAAPLSYVGLGLLLILNRRADDRSDAWARWVVFLAMAGFVGNFGLSLADHAQNGLFSPFEWLAVVSAAYASTFLAVGLFSRHRQFLVICLWLQLLQTFVGIAGFGFHISADLRHATAPLLDRMVFGAPVFAPLLYADLALLASLGLANCMGTLGDEVAVSSSP